ncbi:hypothetical protein RTBOTA2_005600 [Rhodotorula toruloides]|uniref:FGENESH: predicted gene_11.27 protein n=1 Tax=Rhodotorula toruloides TaxID=5286 RepID=A0A0K3CMG8_RHOTO|nr:hypothetical protein RTBOTA2_005600 [Rhodotorula toruloides]PRQ71606.1 hypothetical protein AAT19DRAFT_9721 [Rhodotorula toruloides]
MNPDPHPPLTRTEMLLQDEINELIHLANAREPELVHTCVRRIEQDLNDEEIYTPLRNRPLVEGLMRCTLAYARARFGHLEAAKQQLGEIGKLAGRVKDVEGEGVERLMRRAQGIAAHFCLGPDVVGSVVPYKPEIEAVTTGEEGEVGEAEVGGEAGAGAAEGALERQAGGEGEGIEGTEGGSLMEGIESLAEKVPQAFELEKPLARKAEGTPEVTPTAAVFETPVRPARRPSQRRKLDEAPSAASIFTSGSSLAISTAPTSTESASKYDDRMRSLSPSPPPRIELQFEVRAKLQPGTTLVLVGGGPDLGAWNPHDGILLFEDEDEPGVFIGGVQVKGYPETQPLEYKLAKIDTKTGAVVWERRGQGNRFLERAGGLVEIEWEE